MTEPEPPPSRESGPSETDEFRSAIDRKTRRRLRAREEGEREVTFWLGMFGLVGWSVALPAVMCTFLGVWLDEKFPGSVSWTLTLLLTGMVAGCLNAWYWIQKEGPHD